MVAMDSKKRYYSVLGSTFFLRMLIINCLLFVMPTGQTENYYWVGGSGFWSDINHWATTSGGTALHIQAPMAQDDVIFDENSFLPGNATVTINQKNAVCRNMQWVAGSNQPELNGNDTTSLRIYGSLTLQPNMIISYSGEIYFEATNPNQTITTSGNLIPCVLNFQGNGGSWFLNDDFQSSQTVNLIRGSFSTNGHNFNCFYFNSSSDEPRNISLSTSTIDVETWSINGNNLVLDASQSLFNVGETLSNSNGSRLIYNFVNFTGNSGSLINNNVHGVFKNVRFVGGSVSGNCTIDSLFFQGSASITGSDSISYLIIGESGFVTGGRNVIDKTLCNSDFSLDGDNVLDSLFVEGFSFIIGTNSIKFARLSGAAYLRQNNSIEHLTITGFSQIIGLNSFHWALLKGSSYFSGQNNFDTLQLSKGRTYTFGIFSTTTIQNKLDAVGTCNEPIRMLSDTNGVQATIVKYNGPFVSEYLSVKDLKAEGSTPFVATNSVDLGNNSNWNIQTTQGIDLFWVNGQGEWSDNSHWDIISGGPGGHCPPTEIDNAIFDQNSFTSNYQEVIIDVENAVCHDFNWQDASNHSSEILGTDTNNIRIFGSLYLNGALSNNFLGEVFFEATQPDKTIRSSGKVFKNNIKFDGRGGFWNLEDSLTVSGDLNFHLGGLNTNDNTLTCNKFISTDTTTRSLILGESTIKFKNSGGNVWDVNAQNLTLKADSSFLISFSNGSNIKSFNAPTEKHLVYNNVEFRGIGSSLNNAAAYCEYNVVKFNEKSGTVMGDCEMDTVLFHKENGKILDSDSINAAIFYDDNAIVLGGEHVIKIAYFYKDAIVQGKNKIDTAYFFRNASILDSNFIDTTIVFNKTLTEGANIFRTATLLGDGDIKGNQTFTDLTLTKSKAYYFENGQTQTIIENFNVNGACTGPITLQSDLNSNKATIHKINGNVAGDYLCLRDIKAIGSVLPFIATNSVDLGNNEGWDISVSNSKDLFWVNGTGNWNDSLHWSGTSGGAGGFCIPSPKDNVFFDQNSFDNDNDSVIINIGNATCKSMYWISPNNYSTISGPDTNNLRIYGSLKLDPEMIYAFDGQLYFEATEEGQTIESNGITIKSRVFFYGIGGGWILLDDFTCPHGIDFKYGKLELNQNTLNCGFLYSNYLTPRDLDISRANIITTGSSLNAWHLNTGNLIFDADKSTITSTGNYGLVRTEGGGKIFYNDVHFTGSISRIYSVNSSVTYNNITFIQDGSVHGNCTIDTLLFGGSGSIYDSDSINYCQIQGLQGQLIGGNHLVNTILFSANAEISGDNVIDSTIINGSGNISGTNKINKSLVIGKNASISGQNNFGNTILLGNGQINGPNEFKSLRLTPGNIYELEENATQSIIDNFYLRGNNCFPLTLRSQTEGSQAIIEMSPGKIVSGDFLELRDILATGGASYYAGNFSSDLSNNSGWIFSNSPGYIYGFTGDTTICSLDITVIGTQNFNPAENSTYLWHDGSTNPEYMVKPEDTTVWVTVNYGQECSYTDTLSIFRNPSPVVFLGDDIILCQYDTIFPVQISENLHYEWQDGSTHPFIVPVSSGQYSVTVTNEFGCTAFDEVFVEQIPAPVVNIGNDTIIHAQEVIYLDAGNPGATYFWSTGETSQGIVAGSNNSYWVIVDKDGCLKADTIFIDEYPPCILAVPSAFSPNADGANDILYVRGENFQDFELLIFNRWGQLIFQTNNTSHGWDGTFKGQPQAVDAYNYYLKGKCIDGLPVSSKGTITLLK